MAMLGRRIGARSRHRTGGLMDSTESVNSDVNPDDPGTDSNADDGGTLAVDAGLSVTL